MAGMPASAQETLLSASWNGRRRPALGAHQVERASRAGPSLGRKPQVGA